MRFNELPSDFSAIERHIHAARIERAAYLSQAIVAGIGAVVRGMRRLGEMLGRNVRAEADRRAIEADSFLRRSVPKY